MIFRETLLFLSFFHFCVKPNVLFTCIFNLFFTSKLLQCFPCFVTNLGVQKFANQNMFCFSKRRRHNLITSVVSRSDSETISFCAFKNYTKFYLILLFAIKFSNVLHKNQVQFPCQRLFWLLIMLYILCMPVVTKVCLHLFKLGIN